MRKKIIAVLLACMMAASVVPMSVSADGGDGTSTGLTNTPVVLGARITANNEMGISASFEQALRDALGENAPDASEQLTIEDCQKLQGTLDLSNKGITEISSGAIAYTAKDQLPQAEQERCVGSVWAVSNLARALNNVTELILSGNSFTCVPSCFLMGSPSIAKVVLPDTVEVIGLTPAADGTVFTDSDGHDYAWGYNAFSHMKELTTVNIPASVKYLSDYAFAESVKLEYNIEDLPVGLVATGRKVFDMHESIRTTNEIGYEDVKVTGDIVKYLEKNPNVQFQDFVFEATNVYADAEELVALNYPGTFKGAFGVTNITGKLVIPENTEVSNYCFDGWEITSAVIPESVTLNEYSFINNEELNSITVQVGSSSNLNTEYLPTGDGIDISYEMVPGSITDDASANGDILVAMIEAAKDGEVIQLPAGTYQLDADEVINLDKKITLQGVGESTIIKGSNSQDYSLGMITFNAGSEGSVLKDLTIDYDATGAQSQAVYFNYGFENGSENNVTKIQNVNFVGADTLDSINQEVAIASTYVDAKYIEITDCTFTNFKYAMYFNRVSNLLIEGNEINGTKYNAINIAADGTEENSKCENIVIRDNVMTNISYGNYTEHAYSSGIRFGENASDFTVVNNQITMLNGKLPVFVEEKDNAAQIEITVLNDEVIVSYTVIDLTNGQATFTLPDEPTKAGYTFKGWQIKGQETLYQVGDIVTLTSDTTFTAKWEEEDPGTDEPGTEIPDEETYTVTINGTVQDKEYKEGDIVSLYTPLYTYDGRRFMKWVVTSNNIVLANAYSNSTTFTMPAGNVSVYAYYTYVSYTPVEPDVPDYTPVKPVEPDVPEIEWIQKDGNTYLYIDDEMITGWYENEDGWYWFDENGVMSDDCWEKIDGVWYLFDEDGIMLTGWQKVDGKWYYLKPWGGMATGWQLIDSVWYYLRGDGSMAANAWVQSGGYWYYLTGSGEMATACWIEWKGDWYYLYSSGIMATNTTIDGCYIDSNGIWRA